MSQSMKDAARLFRFNSQAVHARVIDLTPTEWRHQIAESSTPQWIVGHLCVYRRNLLRWTGADVPTVEWEPAFAKGTRPADHPARVGAKQLLDDFATHGDKLADALDALTDADLAKPTPRKFSDGSDTLGGAAMFLLWHETYHVGQLGLIRKILGKPSL